MCKKSFRQTKPLWYPNRTFSVTCSEKPIISNFKGDFRKLVIAMSLLVFFYSKNDEHSQLVPFGIMKLLKLI